MNQFGGDSSSQNGRCLGLEYARYPQGKQGPNALGSAENRVSYGFCNRTTRACFWKQCVEFALDRFPIA